MAAMGSRGVVMNRAEVDKVEALAHRSACMRGAHSEKTILGDDREDPLHGPRSGDGGSSQHRDAESWSTRR